MITYLLYSAVPLAAFSGYYTYKFHPDVLLKLFFRWQLYRQNFKIKYLRSENRTFCYAHRVASPSPSSASKVKRPTLLLLHGFSASKDMWVWMAGFLPRDMEVISLDLPGHGETTTTDDDDLSIEGQADAVYDFVTRSGIDPSNLHICGQSMGGGIAGTYASKYNTSLSMVTLLCPAVKTPKLSKFMEAVLNGGDIHDWLVPESEEQVQKMFNACTYNPKPSSPTILKAVLNIRRPKNVFYMKLWATLYHALEHSEEHMAKFAKVSVPGQVIWGEHDDVIDVSGAEQIKANNPHVRVDIVERAGHSLAMERARKVASLITQFQDQTPLAGRDGGENGGADGDKKSD